MTHRCPNCGYRLSLEAVTSWGGWTYDPTRYIVNETVSLSPYEGRFFHVLLEAQGRGVTKNAMLTALYGFSDDTPEMKILDVRLMNVRNKLKRGGFASAITSIYGRGFSLNEHPPGSAGASKSPREP